VASGDPTTDSVVIWTRATGGGDSVPLTWTVARDRELQDVVAAGKGSAVADADHTFKTDVEGLDPGETYFYGFNAEGADSPVGRTWTLRSEPKSIRFATCSCAKFNAGYFNAYARMAEREDLDFLLHLGDYIYEAGNVPAKGQTPGADIGRDFEPLGECRTLSDYRTRYAQYRRDPDVQALHHALPIVPMLDDHELADGAWAGGSDAHDPAEHGPWSERKASAFRARSEWLPIRPPDPDDPSRVFRRLSLGGLADILMLDIRSRRDQPALEPEMSEPGRSMLGAEQREWLFAELESSTAAWRLVASPSILIRTWCDHPSELVQEAMLKLKLMDEDGEGPDEDQWDGYPAERSALLDRLRTLKDVVVLSADIHVSVAAEVADDGADPVAVELTAPSLTSQNLDEKLGLEPRDERILDGERAWTEAMDHVHWCEMASHGYVVCDVDAERVRAEWWHVDGVLERTPGERRAAAFEVRRGAPRLSAVAP
jgi:phosphodiesterase/alkaline phosphatase D-like protein